MHVATELINMKIMGLMFFLACCANGLIVPCTQDYTLYKAQLQSSSNKYSYSCGWAGLSRCYKYKAKYAYVTVSYLEEGCCENYANTSNICLPICDTSCGKNKECSLPNTCTCTDGWKGSDCLTPICDPACGQNQLCDMPDTCICTEGWEGNDCVTAICETSCGKNMECSSPNTCTCTDGWKGSDCQTPICEPACGKNQLCSLPDTCVCIEGWKGNDCHTDVDECSMDTDTCESDCSNIDGSYSCSCESTENSVLANDEERCLSGVTDVLSDSGPAIVSLNWSPPINFAEDGAFDGYNVTCTAGNTKKSSFISSPTTSHTFFQLMPFTNYMCCVVPQWATNGEGPQVCIEQMTLEDSPDDAPQNISLISADSRSILIEWMPPSIPNGIIETYNLNVNYTNGSSIEEITVAGSSTLYLLDNLNVFQLIGVSVGATTAGGEGPKSSYRFNRSGETEPKQVHYLNVDILSNTSANVSWHPPFLLTGVIISYHLVYGHLSANDTIAVMNEYTFASTDRNFLIGSLEPFVPYEISIAAATKIGKGEIMKKIFFTHESVPAVAPVWLMVDRSTATEIQAKWAKLSLMDSRGFIKNYMFTYATSVLVCSIVENEITLSVHSEKDMVTLSDLSACEDYCISVGASTALGTGAFSIMRLVKMNRRQNIFLYIHGMQECESWILANVQKKLDDLSKELVISLHTSCKCNFDDYLCESAFLKCDNGAAVVQLSITEPSKQGDELLEAVEKWASGSPGLTMDNVLVTVKSLCWAANNSDGCSSSSLVTTSVTKNNTDTSSGSSSVLFAGGSTLTIIGASAVVGLIAVIALIITVSVCIKRKSTKRNTYDVNKTLQSAENDSKQLTGTIPTANPCYGEVKQDLSSSKKHSDFDGPYYSTIGKKYY